MRLAIAAALALSGVPAAAQDMVPAAPLDRSQDIAWHNSQQAYIAALKPDDGWRYLPGGLKWRRIAGDNTGAKPAVEDIVTVHYAGTLTDGTSFDSSFERGEPATFPLGALIKAWQLAIPQMGVGDTIELAAPGNARLWADGQGPHPWRRDIAFQGATLGYWGSARPLIRSCRAAIRP